MQETNYDIHLDIKYQHQEVIDVNEIIGLNKEKWFNQTLSKINDSVARIGIFEGEFHWHKHDNDDEFFFVLEGTLYLDTEEKTFELTRWQGMTIGKGVLHRTRAPHKTIVLMVENAGIKPTGD